MNLAVLGNGITMGIGEERLTVSLPKESQERTTDGGFPGKGKGDEVVTTEEVRAVAIKTRMAIKVLWLANWNTEQIAEYLELPTEIVQAFIDIYSK